MTAITHRRRNPSARAITRTVYRRGASSLGGLRIGETLKNQIPFVAGMLAAKWAAKRFGGPTDREDWTMKNYAIGAVGAFAASFLAENIRRGSGQKVLEGGIALLLYKIFINEVSSGNEFLNRQFGQTSEPEMLGASAMTPEYQGYGQGDLYLADDGQTYVMGQDGAWRPVEGDGATEQPAYMGETVARPTNLGETVARPTNLGAADPFARALFGEERGDNWSKVLG